MGRHVADRIYLILCITYGDECIFRTMFVSDLRLQFVELETLEDKHD